ncbi:hypothetical protein KPH14_009770 [Odynerus spinipes]|uniref:Uncharacterized protein n=1 Tax=Odynerus spinipes TaxID=1348599 RepID=A0AAD9VLI0_9HYME|nr:hypothetical protein KPH14_009770 [Odynerus spinipes]
MASYTQSGLHVQRSNAIRLRTSYKEDLNASPAEMLYGTELRVPGEFFIATDIPTDSQFFLEKFREHIRSVRPTPMAHHIKARPFILKDLHTCSHVFKRIDSVRKPLEPPYSGPHRVIKRVNDCVLVILVNGEEKTVSIDCLKPAYIAKEDTSLDQSLPRTAPEVNRSVFMDKPLVTYQKKTVSFLPSRSKSPGRE